MKRLATMLTETELGPLQLVVIGGTLLAMNVLALSAFVFLVYNVRKSHGDWLLQIVKRQFAALVLMPILVGTAVCIVFMFEVTTGAVEFSVLGLTFKGASGPIVFWVLCFLALVAGLKLLWHGEAAENPGKSRSQDKI